MTSKAFIETIEKQAGGKDPCAVVTPGRDTLSGSTDDESEFVETPTDQDVLCGRGKGIRRHPGNALYNRLLKENFDEYRTAPKGSKSLIVKKILSSIREGQSGGSGRFLELTKRGKNTRSYIDIGDKRAFDKTAQAFRDIRVTNEKLLSRSHYSHSYSHSKTTSDEGFSSDNSGFLFSEKVVPASRRTPGALEGDGLPGDGGDQEEHQGRRRPTYLERIAMLHRQQQQEAHCESSVDDDDNTDDDSIQQDSGNEDEVSDTETEESFPMYNSKKT